jgi:hypothetical protein
LIPFTWQPPTWKHIGLVALGAGLPLLVGCASSIDLTLLQSHNPPPVERKTTAPERWKMLVEDTAKQTLASMVKLGLSGDLYVALPPSPSGFDREFQQLLVAELLKNGQPIMQYPTDQTLQIVYQTRLVGRNSPNAGYVPEGFMLVGTGLSASYDSVDLALHEQALTNSSLAGSAALIRTQDPDKPPATELTLHTSFFAGGRYLMRKTDVYYVESVDPSFMQYKAHSKVLKVVGQ